MFFDNLYCRAIKNIIATTHHPHSVEEHQVLYNTMESPHPNPQSDTNALYSQPSRRMEKAPQHKPKSDLYKET